MKASCFLMPLDMLANSCFYVGRHDVLRPAMNETMVARKYFVPKRRLKRATFRAGDSAYEFTRFNKIAREFSFRGLG